MKQMKMSKKEKVPEESEPQYHFQGQSSGSQHWFYIDTDWVEDNFMTREPDFFKSLHLKHIKGQRNKDWF